MDFLAVYWIIFFQSDLLAAILKIVNLTMNGQYFSLETVISEIYAKFPIRMMLSPNSTYDVRMVFILPAWSLDYNNHNLADVSFNSNFYYLNKYI